MFDDCKTLLELTVRAKELRTSGVLAQAINTAMNARKLEIISEAKRDVKSVKVYPPKDDIATTPITTIQINITDISAPYVIFKDGVLTI